MSGAWMKKIRINQFKNGKMSELQDNIAEENILHLEINSDVSFDVVISPDDIMEFVYGNLFSEGFIQDKGEVKSYKENIKRSLIMVKVKLADFPDKKVFLKKNYNIVWTECGSSAELIRLQDQFKPITFKDKIKGSDIIKLSNSIKDKTELFKLTGAFHYAFAFNRDLEVVSYAHDIGRHNAVDKVFGSLILDEATFEDKILFITGRISSDILLKCLRTRLPILVSRGAPLANAVELAKKYNMCLIGFLRGNRFNVYSNPEAILSE
jgi:FdhD protein